MNKTGGVIGIIAGVFALIAALVTLLFGGVASAFHANSASTVVGLGWGGVLFSFAVIVFGALAFSKPKLAGKGMIVSSICGVILGGTLVAIFMVLALIGGILCLIGAKAIVDNSDGSVAIKNLQNLPKSETSSNASVVNGASSKKKSWPVIIATSVAVLVILAGVSKSMKKENTLQGDSLALSKMTLDELVQADDSKIDSKTFSEWAGVDGDSIAAFDKIMGKDTSTSVQKQNRLIELQKNLASAKGKIVIWDLIVGDVSKSELNYSMKTKCDPKTSGVIGLGLTQSMQPEVDVILESRNVEDKKIIETLKSCNSVKIKGRISGYDNDGRIYLNPAILIEGQSYVAEGVRGYKDALKNVGTSAVPEPINQASIASTPIATTSQEVEMPAVNQKVSADSASNSISDVPAKIKADEKEMTLPEVDSELNLTYKALMMRLDKAKQAELKREELSWIRSKDKECERDSGCLKQRTVARLSELKGLLKDLPSPM